MNTTTEESDLLRKIVTTKENKDKLPHIYEYSKLLAIENRLHELLDMVEFMQSIDPNYEHEDIKNAKEIADYRIKNRTMKIYG